MEFARQAERGPEKLWLGHGRRLNGGVDDGNKEAVVGACASRKVERWKIQAGEGLCVQGALYTVVAVEASEFLVVGQALTGGTATGFVGKA